MRNNIDCLGVAIVTARAGVGLHAGNLTGRCLSFDTNIVVDMLCGLLVAADTVTFGEVVRFSSYLESASFARARNVMFLSITFNWGICITMVQCFNNKIRIIKTSIAYRSINCIAISTPAKETTTYRTHFMCLNAILGTSW